MTKQEFNNSILKRGYSYCPSKLLSEEYDINYRYEVNRWSTRDFGEGIQKHNTIYSKEDFLYVIKIGLGYEFLEDIKFDDVESQLVELYNDTI